MFTHTAAAVYSVFGHSTSSAASSGAALPIISHTTLAFTALRHGAVVAAGSQQRVSADPEILQRRHAQAEYPVRS